MPHNYFRSVLRTTTTLLVAVAFIFGLTPGQKVAAQNFINDTELTAFTANGLNTATLSWSGGTGSFDVNIYMSADLTVDAGDSRLGSVTVADASTLSQDYFIGSNSGEMPLPLGEVSQDYYLLAQVKDSSTSLAFIGVYYVPAVNVASGTKIAPFVFPDGEVLGSDQPTGSGIEAATYVILHGGEVVDTVTFNGKRLQWSSGGTPITYDYSSYQAFGFSLHLHGGNDVASASQNVFTAMYGGAGRDILNTSITLMRVYLDGGSGNDTLRGSNQNDTLIGGDDNDNMTGGLGDDNLNGGLGDDFLRGSQGDDSLTGGGGSDTVTFTSATGSVICDLSAQLPVATCTGDGKDSLSGISNLVGGPFNDTLKGDSNDNSLDGYLGNDYLYGLDGNDVLEGGEGNDYLYGGNGDDTLKGGNSDDHLYGEAGNDVVGGSFGNDLVDCGPGTQDWVNFDSDGSNASVKFDLHITTTQNTIGQGIDTTRNCENIIGSPMDDVLTGNDSANQIRGMGGNDTINGAGGPDILDGGPGANTLIGGVGSNVVTYERINSSVTVDLAAGTGSGGVNSQVRSDTFPSHDIQSIIGSPYDDKLFGDAGNNFIDGDGGSDQMDGRGGTDTVLFASYAEGVNASLTLGTAVGLGSGIFTSTLANFENITGSAFGDIIEGDCGNNVLDGAVGIDMVSFEHQDSCMLTQAAVTGNGTNAINGVNVSLQAQTATGRGTDSVKNFENLTGTNVDDILNGSVGDNIIHGLAGNDNIIGNSRNDQLFGDDGNDTLTGDRGADMIDGGAGTDLVTFLTSTSGANVDLSNHISSNDGWGTSDTIFNCENLEGTNYADYLKGDDGPNSIWGYNGNDVLVGLMGADKLYGGSGNDTLSAYLEGVSSSDSALDTLDGGAGTGDAAFAWIGLPDKDKVLGIP